MTTPAVKQPLTKSKIVALSILCVLAAVLSYSAVMKLMATPQTPEQISSTTPTSSLPVDVPTTQLADPLTPPALEAKSPLLSLSPAAREYLSLSKQALLDAQREKAFIAEEKAKAAKRALEKPPAAAVEATAQTNLVQPNFYDAGLPPPEPVAPKVQLIDKLHLVSIIENDAGIKAIVKLDGNLVPISEGTHIGSIEVLALMSDHAVVTDGKREKTLWVTSK